MSAVLTFDDTDPAISYLGDWEPAGGPDEYESTTIWTNTPGASAQITFMGTGISVFGTITRQDLFSAPISRYQLDNDSSMAAQYIGQQTVDAQYRVRFFSVTSLKPGVHTLTITNESDKGQLFLDYFEVRGLDSSGTGILSSRPSDTPLPSSFSDSGNDMLGAIVGGTLGGLALVCLTVVILFALRWRRKRRKDIEEPESPKGIDQMRSVNDGSAASSITPFVIPSQSTNSLPIPTSNLYSAPHTATGSYPQPAPSIVGSSTSDSGSDLWSSVKGPRMSVANPGFIPPVPFSGLSSLPSPQRGQADPPPTYHT
ncbi:hypothetical protein CC1G_07111 [Coprinopsis cinerea okayama7|uniref:Uncharacterized protein n=1 Tax=Coprinopsis cinerea (strain Okayama-7 / 130 / ATCC MYA-4618 / FGSC 9003) TaxID=240176 RepID=A8NUI1_COPC7|nr:hypothetical protein CC1G_07111 [Coprinopsis cinerea okayama7\|eukprot:XP_001836464.1 hypothetical protein CC1G_07111 [Coprinopsis cinerea okayama7\